MTERDPETTIKELRNRDDVRRVTDAWTDCDAAAVVPDSTDTGVLRDEYPVSSINNFDAAPYTLVKMDLT